MALNIRKNIVWRFIFRLWINKRFAFAIPYDKSKSIIKGKAAAWNKLWEIFTSQSSIVFYCSLVFVNDWQHQKKKVTKKRRWKHERTSWLDETCFVFPLIFSPSLSLWFLIEHTHFITPIFSLTKFFSLNACAKTITAGGMVVTSSFFGFHPPCLREPEVFIHFYNQPNPYNRASHLRIGLSVVIKIWF